MSPQEVYGSNPNSWTDSWTPVIRPVQYLIVFIKDNTRFDLYYGVHHNTNWSYSVPIILIGRIIPKTTGSPHQYVGQNKTVYQYGVSQLKAQGFQN